MEWTEIQNTWYPYRSCVFITTIANATYMWIIVDENVAIEKR